MRWNMRDSRVGWATLLPPGNTGLSAWAKFCPLYGARLRAALATLALTFAAAGAQAQDLEPRSFTNTPVGLNFLIGGYAYAEGKLAFDPSLPIADGQFHSDTAVFAYARSLDAWGKSAKFDVVVPYTSFSGHAEVGGQTKRRDMSGYNDPLFRFSINFYGAPALSLKDFASFKQDVIIGASLRVSAPLGQYDNSKLINLGNNRWSFKPQLGISKAFETWTLEVAPGATFFTDNTDFNRGGTFSQAPIYSVEGHLVRSFQSGIWLALDATYYTGGRTTVNGVEGNTMQRNSRAGLTLAIPVDRYNSIKLYGSANTSTRTGTAQNVVGIAWQYRWGGGF
jgi:hypothetical protein